MASTEPAPEPDSHSLIGSQIGRIQVTHSLGKGGMGEVYAGWDETLQRRVALKAIRNEQRFNAEAKARFLREARILSQLDHPGICRIHELIEHESGDFLVLELIEGQSLKQALADGIDPAFQLFIAEKVAEALAAAHAQGVVHRDLKPENVMLTADGWVKVLDFGLANSVDDETASAARQAADSITRTPDRPGDFGDESTVLQSASESNAQGLPPNVDVTTTAATVIGTTVIGPTTVIGQTEEPNKPAADPEALSTDSEESFHTRGGMVMGTVAYMSPEQARGEQVTSASDVYSLGLIMQEMFTGLLPYDRDQDAFSMLVKAGAGETLPIDGVDSDLTILIERLQAMAPVARPSAAEVVERLWWIRGRRQRRLRWAALAAVLLLLLSGGVKYLLDLRQERQLALEAQHEAEQVSDFLMSVFAVADPQAARGNDVTARELLDAGADKIRRGLSSQPATQARLMLTMSRVYRQLGLYEQALPLAIDGLALRNQQVDENPDAERAVATASYLDQLAHLYHDLGKFEEARPLLRQSLEIRQRELGETHPHVAASLGNLAFLQRALGADHETEKLLTRAHEILLQAYGEEHPEVARSLNNLGDLYRSRGEHDRAAPFFERSIELQERLLGPDHPDLISFLNNLAMVYHEQGEPERAEALYRRTLKISKAVLGDDHPNVATLLNNIAELYRLTGRFAEAEPLYQQALRLQQTTLGRGHPRSAATLANLASLRFAQGNSGDAAQLLQRALEIEEAALGRDHPTLSTTLNRLADVVVALGDDRLAEALYMRCLGLQEGVNGRVHPGLAGTLADLAMVLTRDGRFEEAEALFSRAEALHASSTLQGNPANRERLAAILVGHGILQAKRGAADSAHRSWNRAVDLLAPLAANSEIRSYQHTLARALLLLERVDEAQPWIETLQGTGWRHPEFRQAVAAATS